MIRVQLESEAGLRQKIRVIGEEHTMLATETNPDFTFYADEPKALGGGGTAPNSYEYLLGALGACTSITLRMYAERKGWPLKHVGIELAHEKRESSEGKKFDWIEKKISLQGDLSDEQITRLKDIADKCPVSRTLEASCKMETSAVRV
jgi:uncharacterized OsmC-like protein